jgi:hypothetical protein
LIFLNKMLHVSWSDSINKLSSRRRPKLMPLNLQYLTIGLVFWWNYVEL